MLPDRVSNPGPLTYESGALPIALRGPAPASSRRETLVLHVRCCRQWHLKFCVEFSSLAKL